MKKLGIVVTAVLALALLAAVAAGCTYSYDANNVTGGGWLPSKAANCDGDSKATFAFQGKLLECVPDELVWLKTYYVGYSIIVNLS